VVDTIRVPQSAGEIDPENSAYMFLNVINSYAEKISFRQMLMEDEQGISIDEELRDFIKKI